LFAFLLAGLAFASTNRFTLSQPTLINGTELAPGHYRFELQGQRIITMQHSKAAAESPVKIENGSEKYASTSVTIDTSGGQNRLEEIRVGGTHVKLVFD